MLGRRNYFAVHCADCVPLTQPLQNCIESACGIYDDGNMENTDTQTKPKAKTLTVILPNGEKATRKTVHQYCYAVAAVKPGNSDWGVLSWHHSYDNAEIQRTSNWSKVYSLRIVPVIENMWSI